MQNQAIDIHHHYVPKQLIDETKRHGKALGVDITDDKGSHALSFAGSKPHRLQPALLDVDRRIEIMDEGQVALATLEANTNSLGYRLTGEQGGKLVQALQRLHQRIGQTTTRPVRRHGDRSAPGCGPGGQGAGGFHQRAQPSASSRRFAWPSPLLISSPCR